MVEVRLDQEIRAQGGGLAGVGSATAEALLPLRAGAVGDGGDFAGELHAVVRRDFAVVVAAVPVGIHHQDLALGVAHGDTVGVASGAAANGDEAADAVGEEGARGEGEHAAHAGADAGVEGVDAEVVEEAELGADHVVDGEDGEARGVVLSVGRVDAAGACGAVAAAEDICANDKVLVCVEGAAGADESLPPARLGVELGGVCVGGGG